MGNSSAVSELKAVMSIKRFRQDLDRNLGKLVEVESKIKYLNNKAIDYACDAIKQLQLAGDLVNLASFIWSNGETSSRQLAVELGTSAVCDQMNLCPISMALS